METSADCSYIHSGLDESHSTIIVGDKKDPVVIHAYETGGVRITNLNGTGSYTPGYAEDIAFGILKAAGIARKKLDKLSGMPEHHKGLTLRIEGQPRSKEKEASVAVSFLVEDRCWTEISWEDRVGEYWSQALPFNRIECLRNLDDHDAESVNELVCDLPSPVDLSGLMKLHEPENK